MLELKIAKECGITENSKEWNALKDVVDGKSNLGDAAFFYGANFNVLCGIVDETSARRKAASALGKLGGLKTSPAKKKSSAENGCAPCHPGKRRGRPSEEKKDV